MNKLFRNAILSSTSKDTRVHALQLLFAHLQLGRTLWYDTTAFIDAYNLDRGYQQDACEFMKLLLSSIEQAAGIKTNYFQGREISLVKTTFTTL